MKANRGPKPSDTFKKIRTSQKPGYFPGREPLALTEPKSLAERTHQNVEARLVRTHQDGEMRRAASLVLPAEERLRFIGLWRGKARS
jgi:hypothetical protein